MSGRRIIPTKSVLMCSFSKNPSIESTSHFAVTTMNCDQLLIVGMYFMYRNLTIVTRSTITSVDIFSGGSFLDSCSPSCDSLSTDTGVMDLTITGPDTGTGGLWYGGTTWVEMGEMGESSTGIIGITGVGGDGGM